MQDSTAYQAALEAARIEGLQQALLIIGRIKLGGPSDIHQATLAAIKDRKILERMCVNIFTAKYWPELLDTRFEIRGKSLASLELIEQAQKLTLLLGSDKFGDPDDTIMAAIIRVEDFNRLARMGRAVFQAHSWQEVLETP